MDGSPVEMLDALIQHGTMTTDNFDFKSKELALNITHGVISDAVKIRLNPSITTTGMIADLVKSPCIILPMKSGCCKTLCCM